MVVASFLFGSVWPHGYLSWETLTATAERWAETASRLALPMLALVVGLLLPLYLAPLGSKDLEEKASTDEESLTATDHEVLAIQDVRENLILILATVGSVAPWWMLPAGVENPVFGILVIVLAVWSWSHTSFGAGPAPAAAGSAVPGRQGPGRRDPSQLGPCSRWWWTLPSWR